MIDKPSIWQLLIERDNRFRDFRDMYYYLNRFQRDSIHKEIVRTKCILCGEIKPCAFKKPTLEIYACEECIVVESI